MSASEAPAHSPLPWHVETERTSTGTRVVMAQTERIPRRDLYVAQTISGLLPGEEEANAEFIVRACNSFDALVAALHRLIEASELPRECTHGQEPDYCDGCRYAMEIASRDARIHARAAIAKAEGHSASGPVTDIP